MALRGRLISDVNEAVRIIDEMLTDFEKNSDKKIYKSDTAFRVSKDKRKMLYKDWVHLKEKEKKGKNKQNTYSVSMN